MKRMIWILLLAALLCACSGQSEPVIEIDTRAQNTPVPTAAGETPDVVAAPTEQPKTPATEAPATETPASYADRVIAAWDAAGLLEGYAPYSEEDMLDLYGIDLSVCISGAGYAETAGYTDEIVLIEADEGTAGEVYALLADHLELMKVSFRSYDAEAYALVEHAVLQNENGVVLMIVSPQAEALLDAFRGVGR